MSGFRLYFRYVGVAMRSQLQYPASFILHALGSMLFTMTHLISLVMLFQRFDTLGQWTLGEAMLFYGMAYMASALAKIYMRGLMMVGSMVQSGEFDRILLRPRSALLQTMGADLQFMRVGEFLDGLIPFAIGVIMVRPGWGAAQWLLIIAAVTLGSLTYAGIALIRAMVPDATLTPRSTRLGSSSVALDHPVVRRAITLGRVPFGSPTLSDQALIHCPSVKIGPGDSARSHTAGEYILHSEIREAIDTYTILLSGLRL